MVSDLAPPRKAWFIGTALAGVIAGVMMTVGALVDWSTPEPWTPPMVVHSVSVLVNGGEPVSALEHRTIERAFLGEWATRVHAIIDGVPHIVCKRPPNESGYSATYTTLGENFLSLTFDDYIGDKGQCRSRIMASPGTYLVVIERHDVTGGESHALDLISSPTFVVGAP
jgi:hypothetical protein